MQTLTQETDFERSSLPTQRLRTELTGADVPDVQLQKSAGKMEFATILVQNYQYDPATVQGFMRLVCSNRSLLQQHREDTQVSSTMQLDLKHRKQESKHKLPVIAYVQKRLDSLWHIEEKDRISAAFKHNLTSVAGPLNVRLKFQVDCPDCYRQHKRILDDFTTCVSETSGTYDKQWSTKCTSILRKLPCDCDQWGYFAPIGASIAEAHRKGLGILSWQDYDAEEVEVMKQDSALRIPLWARFERS